MAQQNLHSEPEPPVDKLANHLVQVIIDDPQTQMFVHQYACRRLGISVDTIIGGEAFPENFDGYERYYDLVSMMTAIVAARAISLLVNDPQG